MDVSDQRKRILTKYGKGQSMIWISFAATVVVDGLTSFGESTFELKKWLLTSQVLNFMSMGNVK